MSSRAQKEAQRWSLIRGHATIPEGRFEHSSEHARIVSVRCALCHAKGLGLSNPQSGHDLSPWQIPHCFDHLAPCRCGLVFLNDDHLRRHVRLKPFPMRALEHGPVPAALASDDALNTGRSSQSIPNSPSADVQDGRLDSRYNPNRKADRMTEFNSTSEKARALRAITNNVTHLYRALGDVERDAKTARDAIMAGNAVAGSTLGYGPIGHQAPFEVAKYTASVSTAVDVAMMLGATADEIKEAYVVL